MTSQPGEQAITIHRLLNISRIKGNRTMKIWSVNRISQEKYFSLKIMQKMRQGSKWSPA